jgi:hypothetical protein
MSPELLDPKKFGASDPRPTKESDRFALAMVIYEVRVCNYCEILAPPFAGILRDDRCYVDTYRTMAGI